MAIPIRLVRQGLMLQPFVDIKVATPGHGGSHHGRCPTNVQSSQTFVPQNPPQGSQGAQSLVAFVDLQTDLDDVEGQQERRARHATAKARNQRGKRVHLFVCLWIWLVGTYVGMGGKEAESVACICLWLTSPWFRPQPHVMVIIDFLWRHT